MSPKTKRCISIWLEFGESQSYVVQLALRIKASTGTKTMTDMANRGVPTAVALAALAAKTEPKLKGYLVARPCSEAWCVMLPSFSKLFHPGSVQLSSATWMT